MGHELKKKVDKSGHGSARDTIVLFNRIDWGDTHTKPLMVDGVQVEIRNGTFQIQLESVAT